MTSSGRSKNAVTNWNDAFGYTALDVKVASATDSYADDDKNSILYDLDPSFGAAFANWRRFFSGFVRSSREQRSSRPQPYGMAQDKVSRLLRL